MVASVDGTPTSPDAHGIIQGDGGEVDKITGTSGNDRLQGHAAFNQYYGGGGSDTFIISSKFAAAGAHNGQSLNFADQYAYITDFQGAGGWSASDNDFIAFNGFGAGSTLALEHSAPSGSATTYYYAIHDGVTGDVFNVMVKSLNGQALGAGDYAFT